MTSQKLSAADSVECISLYKTRRFHIISSCRTRKNGFTLTRKIRGISYHHAAWPWSSTVSEDAASPLVLATIQVITWLYHKSQEPSCLTPTSTCYGLNVATLEQNEYGGSGFRELPICNSFVLFSDPQTKPERNRLWLTAIFRISLISVIC